MRAPATVIRQQRQAIWISAIVTAIAAVLGFVFAMLVGSGITRPVLRLLEGTREVEAGRLDRSIAVTTGDEIGQLSAAFNRMIERLRQNQRIRETFGRYIDPRIAGGTARPVRGRRHRRPAARDDGDVLRHEGVHLAQRRRDAAGAGQDHEPVSLDHVRADPCASRRDRQIYRRRDHGLLGPALRRGSRAGAFRLPRRGRHDRARRHTVEGAARASRRAQRSRPIAISGSALRPARRWSAASARST